MSQRILLPAALVISRILAMFKTEHPSLTTIYDPSLSFEETVRGARAIRSSKQLAILETDTLQEEEAKEAQRAKPTLPLLGYNRTVLVPNETLKYRGFHNSYQRNGDKTILGAYKIAALEFELLFKFFEKDLQALEAFELLYAVKAGVNRHKNVEFTMPELGECHFDLDWKPLEGFDSSKKPTMYGAIHGSVTVSGMFVVGDPTPAIIEWIGMTLNDYEPVPWIEIPEPPTP